MGLRQKQWAKRRRNALIEILGSKCAHCGKRGRKNNRLEMDCIAPQGDRHHRMESSHRMSFYARQLREGNLQLLCRRCHQKKSRTEQPWIFRKEVLTQPHI